MIKKITVLFLFLFIISCASHGKKQTPQQTSEQNLLPPLTQPEKGPGGSNYSYSSVDMTFTGEGAERVDIFFPHNLTSPVPVVIFIHGYSAISPTYYQYWIYHIVKKGAVVIYPYYQTFLAVTQEKMYQKLVTDVVRGYHLIEKSSLPIITSGVGMIGHSLGGDFAVKLATDIEDYGLPTPLFVFSVEPGPAGFVPTIDFDKIPSAAKLVSLYGDQDFVVGSYSAKRIFYSAKNIPKANRVLIALHTDYRKDYSLTASHFSPLASGDETIDAFDWYGFWKWSVALMNCSFYNQECDFVLKDTENAKFMGKWSDGTPVKQPDFIYNDK